MGTCVRNSSCGCSQVHCEDECFTSFSQAQFGVGYICKQCRYSNSFVATVVFSPKLCSIPGCVSWMWTGADDDNRMQVDTLSRNAWERAKANAKTRKVFAETTQATQTSTSARTVAERDIG